MFNVYCVLAAVTRPCDLLKNARFWPETHCHIDFTQDYSVNLTANEVSVPADVVTVGDFALQSNIGGHCQFSSVLLGEKGSLSNVLLFVNATVRIPPECTSVDVSVIDSVYGTLKNVSVTGSVNLVPDPKFAENVTFQLSRFLGYFWDGSLMNELKSNLKYTKNGGPADDEIKDCFQVNDGSRKLTVSTLKLTGEEYDRSEPLKIHQKSGALATEMEVAISKPLKEHPQLTETLFKDWPERVGQMLADYDHYPRLLLTQNNTSTTKDELAAKEFHWLYENGVYYANGSGVHFCPGLITLDGACVDSCEEEETFQDGICLPKDFQCLNGYHAISYKTTRFSKACVRECPLDKNFVELEDGSCSKCKDDWKATAKGCVSGDCEPGELQFGSGCVAECPIGAVKNEDSATCSYPESKSECPEGKFFVQAPYSSYMRAMCLDKCPENTVLFENQYVYSCPKNFIMLNGQCNESCDDGLPLLESASKAERCVMNCPEGYLNVGGKCAKNTDEFDCEDTYVETPETSICTRCTSSYDGGEYWNRNLEQCVSGCTFLNETFKICETKDDNEHCPLYVLQENQTWKCFSECPTDFKYQIKGSKECVSQCTGSYKFVEDNYCVDSCSGSNQFYSVDESSQIYKCQSECLPPNVYGVDSVIPETKRCSADCSIFGISKFNQSGQCQESCTDPYKYSINNVCVQDCPSTHFISTSDSSVCLEECPDQFRKTIEGVNWCAQCGNDKIRFLDTSLDAENQLYCDSPNKCMAQNGFYKVGKSCVKMTCHEFTDYAKDVPSLVAFVNHYYTYNGECLEECPQDAVFVGEGDKCQQKCNNEEYSITDRSVGEKTVQAYVCAFCESVSSGYYTVTESPAGKLCSSCEGMFKHSNQECNALHCSETETNNIFNNAGTCVAQCPTPFVMENDVNGATQYECAASCEYAYVTKDIEKGDVHLINQRVCIEKAQTTCLLSDFTAVKGVPECVQTCPEQQMYEENGTCKESCTSQKYSVVQQDAVTRYQCRDECSMLYEENGTQQICIDTCSDSHFSNSYQDGARCVKQCSTSGTPIKFVESDTSKKCVEKCDKFYKYSLKDGVVSLICQEECPDSYVQAINETYSDSLPMCAQTCQLFSTKVYQSEEGKCVATCPDRYDETLKKCSSTCKWVPQESSEKKTCVSDCGGSNSLLVPETNECVNHCSGTYPYVYEGTCVDTCPDSAQLHNSTNHCIASCTSAEPYLNATTKGCAAYCESGAYTVSGDVMACEKKCESYYVVNSSISGHEQSQCVLACPQSNMFVAVDGAQCLQKCDFYTLEGGIYKCQADCPKKYEGGLIEGTMLCRDKCNDSNKKYVALDSLQCVTACEDTQYIDLVDDEMYCKDSCGDKAISTASTPQKCDANCYYYVQDGKKICTSVENQCPQKYPFTQKSQGQQTQCVSACPEYMTVDGDCVSDCPYYYVNATNGQRMCLQSNASCHVESSGTDLESDAVTGLRCEASCSKMDKKRVQLSDGTCAQACPDDQLNQSGVCVTECQSDYFISYDKHSCVKYCVSYSNVGGKKQCNDNCDENWFVKVNGDSFECVEECKEEGYVSADLLCVKGSCLTVSGGDYQGYEDYVYTDGNTCLTKCPSERKYFSEDKTCLEICNPAFVTAEDNYLCTTECSDQYATNEDGMNVCRNGCNSSQYIDGNNCSNVHCADRGNGFENVFAQGMKCVSKCSDETYQFQASNGRDCVKVCETGEKFIEEDGVKKCVSKCDSLYESSYEAVQSIPKCVDVCKDGDKTVYVESGVCTARCSSGFYTVVSAEGVNNNVCQSACDPLVYIPEENGNRCVSDCKQYGMFRDGEKCVKSCPAGSAIKNDEVCDYECFFTTDNGVRKCSEDCEQSKYYDPETRECFEACDTSVYYVNETKCLRVCPDAFPYYDENKVCFDKCPDQTRVDGMKCVSKCESGIYQQEEGQKQCISDCQYYKVKVSDDEIECATTCPETKPNAQEKECVDQCDSGIVKINTETTNQQYYCGSSSCQYFSKQVLGSVTNKICYDSCPEGLPKVYQKECLKSCPKQTFVLGSVCYDNCPAPLCNSEDGQCLDNRMYFQDGDKRRCISEGKSCANTEFPYHIDQQCYATCPGAQKFVINGECVTDCGQSFKGFTVDENDQLECTSCENGLLGLDAKYDNDTKRCVSSCTDIFAKMFKYENTCVKACPQGTLLYLGNDQTVLECKVCVKSEDDQCLYYDDGQNCVHTDKCTDPYGLQVGQQCYSSCGDNKKFVGPDFSCNSQCPKGVPYYVEDANGYKLCTTQCASPIQFIEESGQCVSKCKSGAFQEKSGKFKCLENCEGKYSVSRTINNEQQMQCYDKCTDSEDNRLIQGSTCVSQCSDEYPYLQDGECKQHCSTRDDVNNKKCSSTCTYVTVQTGDVQYRECVDECKGGQPYHRGSECVASCGDLFNDKGTCRETCQYYFVNGSEKMCQDSKCQGLYVEKGSVTQCVTECPENMHSYNGKCDESLCCGEADCEQHKFLEGGVCKDRCDGYVVSEENLTCVEEPCEFYKSDSENNKICVDEDACKYRVQRDNGYECFSVCPSSYNVLDNTCTKDECSAHNRFDDNSVCVTSCSAFVDETGKKCVETCKDMTYVLKGTQKYCTSLSECTFYKQDTLNDRQYNVCVENCTINDFSYIDGESKRKCLSEAECVKYILEDDVTKWCYASCEASGNRFQLGDQCYDRCPQEQQYTKLQQGVYVCTSECNAYSVIDNNKICQDGCNSFFVEEGDVKQCVNKCRKYHDAQSKCVESCPQLVENNQCVDTCADKANIFVDDHVCKQKCDSGKYTVNNGIKECVDNCQEFMSLDVATQYYICKDECDKDEVSSLGNSSVCISRDECTGFIYEQQCVEKCPGSTVQENANSKQCLSKCTDEYPVYVKNDDSSVCVRTCPSDLPIISGGQCVDECTGVLNQKYECEEQCSKTDFIQPIVLNRGKQPQQICVKACQGNYPYIQGNKCQESCDAGYGLVAGSASAECQKCGSLVEDGYCVDSCSVGSVILSGKCYPSCADTVTNPFLSLGPPQECDSECPDFYISGVCVSDCGNQSDKGECKNTCEDGWFYNASANACQQKCEGFVYGGFYCNDTCALRVYVDDTGIKQCLPKCPSATYRNASGECQRYLGENEYFQVIGDENVITKCDAPMFKNSTSHLCTNTCLHYNDSYTCRIECPADSYYQGKLCVSACREDQFIETNKSCASSCSSGYYKNDGDTMVCQDNCVLYLPVGNQFQCVEACPESAPYQQNIDSRKMCVADCTYVGISDNVKKCYTECPGRYRAYEDKFMCVDECSDDEKLYDRQCVNSCKDLGRFDQNGQCVSLCESLYVDTGAELVCVSSCPDTNRFVQSDSDPKCTTCSLFRYNEHLDRVCVEKCEAGEKLVQFNESLGQCQRPEEQCNKYVQLADGEFSCVEACDSPKFIVDDKMCNATCSRYIDAGKANVCVDSCASTYFSKTESGNQCVDECVAPEGGWEPSEFQRKCAQCQKFMVEESKQCVDSCYENNLKAHGERCVSECPGSAEYLQWADSEVFCVAKCDSDYVTEDNVCVNSCSDPSTYVDQGEDIPRLCRNCMSFEIAVDSKCVTGCPTGTIYNELQYKCVSQQGCAFVKEQAFINSDGANDSRILCLDSCETKVFVKSEYGKMCIDECAEGMLTLIKYGYTECIEKCPDDKYYSNNDCVETCEVYMDNPNNDSTLFQCVNDCGVNQGVIFQDLDTEKAVCLSECPEHYQRSGIMCTVINSSNGEIITIVVIAIVASVAVLGALVFYYIKKRQALKLDKRRRQAKTGTTYYSERIGDSKEQHKKSNGNQKLKSTLTTPVMQEHGKVNKKLEDARRAPGRRQASPQKQHKSK